MDKMTPDEFIDLRSVMGLSVSAAGPMLGVNRRTVQRWEEGASDIPHSVALVWKLAAALPAVYEVMRKECPGRVPTTKDAKAEKPVSEHILKRQKAILGGDVTRAQLIALFQKSKGECSYCGGAVHCRFDPRTPYGFDHIKPISSGGKHTIKNLTVCCRRCNLKKGPRNRSQERRNWR